jgi:hypothetical protein
MELVLERQNLQAALKRVRKNKGSPGAATVARNSSRWWKNSGMLIHVAFPISYFDRLGIPRLAP